MMVILVVMLVVVMEKCQRVASFWGCISKLLSLFFYALFYELRRKEWCSFLQKPQNDSFIRLQRRNCDDNGF